MCEISRGERGQSELLGVVLLLAVVGIASAAVVLAAGPTIDGIERQVDLEAIEGSFVRFRTDVASATGETAPRVSPIDAGEGSVRATDGGEFTVSVGDETIASVALGAIEYADGSGSVVAMEGGGVWRGVGERSMPVSGPSITHRGGDGERTLTVSVHTLSGDPSGGEVGVSAVEPARSERVVAGPLAGEVRITVTTAYHNGWAAFLESLGGTTVTTGGDGERRTVVATLGEITTETVYVHVRHREVVLD